ncbi:MAG: hypothetical protein FWC80_03560 [Firmicutes bacterium]|nr:hypothetical protein [Bacillota bacterium]
MNILERITDQISRLINRLPNAILRPEIFWFVFAGLIFAAFVFMIFVNAGGEVSRFRRNANNVVSNGDDFDSAEQDLNNLPPRAFGLYSRAVGHRVPVSTIMTKDACVTQPYQKSGASRMGSFVRSATWLMAILFLFIAVIACTEDCFVPILFAMITLVVFGYLLAGIASVLGRGKLKKASKAYDELIEYLEGEYVARTPRVIEEQAPAVPYYQEEEKLTANHAMAMRVAEDRRVAEIEEIDRLAAEKAAAERIAAMKAEEDRKIAERKAAEKAAEKAAAERAAVLKAEEKRLAAETAALEKAAEKAAKEKIAYEKAVKKAKEEEKLSFYEQTDEERLAHEAAELERLIARTKTPKTPPPEEKKTVKSPYKTKAANTNAAVPEDIVKRIDQISQEGAPLATMKEVAILLQQERAKPENKSPEQQRKLNEALSALLKAMSAASKK